jgi:hypothetical protein
MVLNDLQKKYILGLYNQGLRNPWNMTQENIRHLKELNDYKKLVYDAQTYLLDLDISLKPKTYPTQGSIPWWRLT